MPRLRDREPSPDVFILRIVEGMVFLYGGDTVLAHASCVEHGGRALALVSAGGVGTTTTASTLLSRLGWRYVADDILPLTEGAGAPCVIALARDPR